MRSSLLAIALSTAAAMLALVGPSTANAELPLLGSTFRVAKMASIRHAPSWQVVTRFDLGFEAAADRTAVGRRSYEVMASLPNAESAVTTFDVKPVINLLTNKKLKLADYVSVTLISGKSLLVADVYRTLLSVTPTGFGGGTFTIGGAF